MFKFLQKSSWYQVALILALTLGGTAKANDLNLIVLGVIASSNDRAGVALLKMENSGKVSAFKEGQQVSNNLKIKRIYRKTVEFLKGSQLYSMSVGDSTPTKFEAKPSPTALPVANLSSVSGLERKGDILKVSSTIKESLLGENLSKVLMQAATVPYTQGGKLIGFKLLEIDKGSIYDLAGFQDGDIITHINQLPITDAGRAVKALTSLKAASEATFSFLRSNQSQNLTILVN